MAETYEMETLERLNTVERMVKEAISLGRTALIEPEAKEILKTHSIPVPRSQVVKDVEGALEAAEKIGYPLALKIVSPDILHKSDVGGITLNIKTGRELEDEWAKMLLRVADEMPTASIEGFMLEEMVRMGTEVIVGAIKDEQFGTVAMFGTGGVFVELMKDVSFRLAPLSRKEALSLMREVKGFPLLTGFRGDTPKDIDSVAEVIMKVAEIVETTDGLKELEINPLFVYEKGVIAVDARAVLMG